MICEESNEGRLTTSDDQNTSIKDSVIVFLVKDDITDAFADCTGSHMMST
jgi:hypothetical protein